MRNELGLINLTDTELNDLMLRYDGDGDGCVDIHEFISATNDAMNTNVQDEEEETGVVDVEDSHTINKKKRKNEKRDKKKEIFNRRASLRTQMLATKQYSKKHAEIAFDQVSRIPSHNGYVSNISNNTSGNNASTRGTFSTSKRSNSIHYRDSIEFSEFFEALVRLSNLRFATSDEFLATVHTLEERVILIVDAVCRYAKRSDVESFQNSIMKDLSVSLYISKLHNTTIVLLFSRLIFFENIFIIFNRFKESSVIIVKRYKELLSFVQP